MGRNLKMFEVYSKSDQVPVRALGSMSVGFFKEPPAAVRMGEREQTRGRWFEGLLFLTT